MAPALRSHTKSHHLLLGQRLLNLRDGASPLTLVIDTLEQSAASLVREFTTRAKIGRTKTVLISFATIRKPQDVDVLIKGRGKSLSALRSEITSITSPSPASKSPPTRAASPQRFLVVIDSLNTPAASHPRFISAFLSGIISPSTCVVAVYHADVPLVLDPSFGEYEPHPLTVLCHLATAILRVSSLYQAIERKQAQDRSQEEAKWGLHEGREGVLIGVPPAGHGRHAHDVVLDMEMRRRSGRSVTERFILHRATASSPGLPGTSNLTLLSEHPMFALPIDPGHTNSESGKDNDADMETTFSLGLTDKQRRDREGVVLPYFDAQTDIGAGEGGRILYDLGREDDFDEEEDEI